MFEIKNKQILAQSIKQIEVSAPELHKSSGTICNLEN